MPAKLNEDSIKKYLSDRKNKGFNVIQISAWSGVIPFEDSSDIENTKIEMKIKKKSYYLSMTPNLFHLTTILMVTVFSFKV